MENVFDQFDSRSPSGNVFDQFDGSETEEQKLNFAQRFGEDLDKRREMYQTITDAYLNGEQSYAEGLLQVGGKVAAGAVLDLIGEVVISGGRGLLTITPDVIEDPIRSGLTGVAHEFLNTDIGQRGLEAAVEGVEKWGAFKEENPRSARNIEAVVDVAVLLAPVKGKPKAPTTAIGRTGESFARSSSAVSKKQHLTFTEGLVRPKQMKAIREAEVARTTESGLLKQKWTTPSAAEKSMAQEVSTVSGVSVKKTLQGNYNAIAAEVKRESDDLVRSLSKDDFIVPRAEFRAEMDSVLLKLQDNPLIVGDAAKVAERIVRKMDDLVDINKSSGSGLLRSRKELDAWMRSQKGPNIFDPKLENAMSIALREVRQATNDFISARATNVGVKESLKKQSTLLRAMDNIVPKAADEASNTLLRLWHNGLRLLPLRGEFNQAMAAAFGVGGLGASAIFAPMFTKLAFGSIGAYAAYRYVTGPASRREIGKALKAIDQMIRKTSDAQLIRSLRADRALLLELSKEAKKDINNEQDNE